MRRPSTAARRPLRVLLLALLCASTANAAEKGEWATVHLKSGAKAQGRLVAEDDDSITLLTPDGKVELPRSVVERIVRPGDERPETPPPAPRLRREEPRRFGNLKPWSEPEERRVEELLDRVFAAQDDVARRAAFAELEKTPCPFGLDDLERMREAGQGSKGLHKHVPVPWRKGAPRGWFNLALPNDYSPTKAWPLVLALHGMPSDGDNLVSWYSGYFPKRGYIVLFPTTIHRSSFWPAPAEKRELLKLLRHVARSYRIDYRRIYCTGASGGGIGTWHWLTTLPELFAGGISFSAAGTILDKRLARLKEIPFYVHHGTKDYIPIASVQRSIQMARGYGAEGIELYVSEGTGHTPPGRDFHRAFDWLVKLPPKALSPRYLLEGPEGELPLGYPRHLPFAVSPEADALAKIRAGYKDEVAKWTFPSELPASDLLEAMVEVARIVDPLRDLEAARGEVKRMADAVRKQAEAGASPVERLYALNEVFFQGEGFARDGADPTGEKPEGVALHQVLETKRGNVFTLTGLYVAVARELGLPVHPVVTPYHAFARFDDGKEQVNVEMTEAGGHFDDQVYRVGYGLRRMPSTSALKAKGAAGLIAAQLAALGRMARRGGAADKAAAAATLVLKLDDECHEALLLVALAAKDAKQPQEALKLARRAAKAWPAYAASRLFEGEAYEAIGARKSAIESYREGIRAPLKPYAAEAAYNAELYYRIAAIYAPLARNALKAQRASAVTYVKRFNEAIVAALKHNPRHPAARRLLVEMGGQIH